MKAILYIVTLILVTLTHVFAQEPRILIHRDGPLSFTELTASHGFQSEEYEVTTEDGYILGLFRIPGARGVPILLMHGLIESSDIWVLRGNTSLGITLANLGYDVWFGNVRGNRYSRRHIKLNPDKDPEFWNFSFDEHGYYDLSAIIDTVLKKTGHPKLNAFGHSLGNSIFYVLCSTRTEYNEKVNVLTALAPIAFLDHVKPPVSTLIKVAPELNALLGTLGVNEIIAPNSTAGKLVEDICSRHIFRYTICALGEILPLTGYDVRELDPAFYDVVSQHFPDTTSRKNLYHFAQIALIKSFAKYDYGSLKNLKEYGSIHPPKYDLSKVIIPIVLLEGRNDRLSTIPDVDMLAAALPNVVNYSIIGYPDLSHLDFIFGKHMDVYLFPYIFDVLDKFD